MMDNALVLVTRSGQEGRRLAASIRSLGLVCVPVELVRLQGPEDPARAARELADALPADVLVLTSQEGVRQARKLPGADRLISLPTVVPGHGTAAVAQTQGFARVSAPERGGNSEAMLALKVLTDVAGKRILILAARDGRRLIDRVLAERGASVRRLTIYRRTPLPVPADVLGQMRSAGSLITLMASGASLEYLHDQLDTVLWRKLADGKVLVPSSRIADQACQLGCRQVRVTDGSDHQAMLKALQDAASLT